MRVLLISANQLQVPCPVFPLGLDYVAGALEAHHEVSVVDLCGESNLETVGLKIRSFDPGLVGISLRNIDNTEANDSRSFINDYQNLVDSVREASSAPIVLGGAGFTIFPERMLAMLGADYGIAGEGEQLVELVDRLELGRDPMGLPGVVVPGGSYVRQAWQGDYRRATPDLVPLTHYLANSGILNLQTKRGCPYACIYCTYPGIEGRCLRRFSPKEVGRCARGLQDAGARFLFITDATFNCDPAHNLAVARAMHDSGLTIPWGAFFAPIPMADGYFQELAEHGLTHVEFGTEALCDSVLAAYQKPFSVEQVGKAHQQAVDAGLWVAHYFMLGGPGESPATLQETLTNVQALNRSVCFFFCGVRVYPETPLSRLAEQEGQIEVDGDLLLPLFYRSAALGEVDLEEEVRRYARGRGDWIIGAGGARTERLMQMMYARGHTGPLWEKLIQ